MKIEIIPYDDGTYSVKTVYKDREYFLIRVHYYPIFTCNPNNVESLKKNIIFDSIKQCEDYIKLREIRKNPNRPDTIKYPVIKNEFKVPSGGWDAWEKAHT